MSGCTRCKVENCDFDGRLTNRSFPIPYQHTETFSVGIYGKHPQLRLCHVSDCLVPDLGPQISTGGFNQGRITKEGRTALVGLFKFNLGGICTKLGGKTSSVDIAHYQQKFFHILLVPFFIILYTYLYVLYASV